MIKVDTSRAFVELIQGYHVRIDTHTQGKGQKVTAGQRRLMQTHALDIVRSL